jgi:hypothetical protein
MNMQDKAFPNPHLTSETGMTMRDYFAAKALQSMLTTYSIPEVFDGDVDEKDGTTMPDLIAKDAYIMADAMMEARK